MCSWDILSRNPLGEESPGGLRTRNDIIKMDLRQWMLEKKLLWIVSSGKHYFSAVQLLDFTIRVGFQNKIQDT
jgi:hypothetical protein